MIPPRASLRRRFLLSFAGLLGGLAVVSVGLTAGLLAHSYRSTVEERIGEAGHRFETALREAEEALLFRTRILADLGRMEAMGLEARAVRGVQVYTLRWFKRDGLEVVGMGGREFWVGQGLSSRALDRAFSGIASVELHAPLQGRPMLLGASPREGAAGVAEVIVASMPLDHGTLRRLAAQAGGEIALYGEGGTLLAASLPPDPALREPAVPETPPHEGGSLLLHGVPYAYRTFRLAVGQRTEGVYAVFWPVGDLRALTWRLALWQLGGGSLGFFLFYLLYRRVVARTAEDVEALTSWARSVTPASPSPPPRLARADEVGVLGEAFAALVGGLEQALLEVEVKNRELAEANSSLEGKVEEQTREVERQRRLFETVLSGMGQAVFLVAEDGTVAYANPAAVRAFGPCGGRPCEAVLGAEAPCRADAAAVAELTRGESTYLVSFTPLGSPGQGIVVAQDVTERRALERQLAQSQRLESVGRLAAGVAHDFNNVLGAIVPCVEILRTRVADPRSLGYLDTIDAATGRATEVVRQLLTFSRAGQARRVPLDLSRAVEGALRLLRPALKQVELSWVPGTGLPRVLADETQVQQVVLNLALNAVDAMGGRGTLTLETRAGEGGRCVLLIAEDTGPGIPAELLDRIFDPFFTTKEVGKGTGLGLSIVYGIVERHGGRVRALSPPGRGARFEVELPALGPAQAGPAGDRPPVLLVDDDPLLLRSLARALEELGFAVATAEGAEAAVAAVEGGAAEPGAAVVDLRMPGMDGVALAERLRSLRPDLPLLFMSAFAEDRAAECARLSGRPVLGKPFSPSRLAAVLRELLPADRAARGAPTPPRLPPQR